MIAPFVAIYIFNWVVFVIIFISLLKKACNKKLQELKDDEKSSTKHLKQQLIVAITLSILFGLGWGIGLPATQSIPDTFVIRDIFATLFVLFTAFQGLFVFIMHCLRSPDIRKLWARMFKMATGKEVTEFTSSVVSGTRKVKKKPPSYLMNTKSTSLEKYGHSSRSDAEVSFESSDDGMTTLRRNVQKAGLLNSTSTLERYAKGEVPQIEEERYITGNDLLPQIIEEEAIVIANDALESFEEDIQHGIHTFELPEGVFNYNFDSKSVGGITIISEDGKECTTFENPMELLPLDDPFNMPRSGSQFSFRSENFVDITQTSFTNPMTKDNDEA